MNRMITTKAISTARTPFSMVSAPRVAGTVASLTGCRFSVAGRAPERRMFTSRSTSRGVKLPLIWPCWRISELMVGADTIRPSRMIARWRLTSLVGLLDPGLAAARLVLGGVLQAEGLTFLRPQFHPAVGDRAREAARQRRQLVFRELLADRAALGGRAGGVVAAGLGLVQLQI